MHRFSSRLKGEILTNGKGTMHRAPTIGYFCLISMVLVGTRGKAIRLKSDFFCVFLLTAFSLQTKHLNKTMNNR